MIIDRSTDMKLSMKIWLASSCLLGYKRARSSSENGTRSSSQSWSTNLYREEIWNNVYHGLILAVMLIRKQLMAF